MIKQCAMIQNNVQYVHRIGKNSLLGVTLKGPNVRLFATPQSDMAHGYQYIALESIDQKEIKGLEPDNRHSLVGTSIRRYPGMFLEDSLSQNVNMSSAELGPFFVQCSNVPL